MTEADGGIRLKADATDIVIAQLRGRILEKHPNRVIVDVHGVGYDVFVPLSTFYGLGDAGAEITLRTHTHVREDALALYGFATLIEQQLFERLIGVSGIGPRVALAVLSVRGASGQASPDPAQCRMSRVACNQPRAAKSTAAA